MKHLKLPLAVFALLVSSLVYSQTSYYTTHAGSWNDPAAWSTINFDTTTCSCSPGCGSLTETVYIGSSITSTNCLSNIGNNAVITIEPGDTLTVTLNAGGKLPVSNSTINIFQGGVMIVNGEIDIAAGDTINNLGTLTVNGNVSDSAGGAYLAGNGVFGSTGSVTGTSVFINPQGLWVPVSDTNGTDTGKTNIVYNGGNVGIGTSNPTKPLQVQGSVLISDTLNVAAVQSHRIALFPGDSLIRMGDSCIVLNMHNNNIYGEQHCIMPVGDFLGGTTCTPYTSIALGINNRVIGTNYSCAVGINNRIKAQAAMVMGISSNAGADGTITIGNNLSNNITGSIMLGGFHSSSHVPALTIIPDMSSGSAGFVGIGTIAPDAIFDIFANSSLTNQFAISTSSNDVFTIDQSGNTNAAGNLIVAGSTISMPGIVTDTTTDLLQVDIHGNVTPISKSAIIGFVNSNNGGNSGDNTCLTPVESQWSYTPMQPNTSDNPSITTWNNCFSVGIDYQTPTVPLEVGGNAIIQDNLNAGSLTTSQANILDHAIIGSSFTTGTALQINLGSTINPLAIQNATTNTTLFTIDKDGNTFINGTLVVNNQNSPVVTMPAGYGLYVGNGILTEKVKIALHTDNSTWSWPDYVLYKNYRLQSLSELEKYIDLNKHLPDVPSSSDLKKDGIDIATMDATLLKKVEELTLYIIQQQKEIDQLQKKVNTLSKTEK